MPLAFPVNFGAQLTDSVLTDILRGPVIRVPNIMVPCTAYYPGNLRKKFVSVLCVRKKWALDGPEEAVDLNTCLPSAQDCANDLSIEISYQKFDFGDHLCKM